MKRALVGGVVVLGFVTGFGVWLASCGTDIDLGGGADAGTPDAVVEASTIDATDASMPFSEDAESDDCEPCSGTSDCHPGSDCVAIDAGNPYCIPECDAGKQCEPDEQCSASVTTEAKSTGACTPLTGTCPSVAPAQSPDGSVLDRCGNLVGPKLNAPCKTCEYDCQTNGCYGGFWCNIDTKRCVKPPRTCT